MNKPEYLNHVSPEIRDGLKNLSNAEELQRNPPTPRPNDLASGVAGLASQSSEMIERDWNK